MVSSDSTIIELSNLIGNLHKERDEAVKKRAELDEQVKAIEQQIQAVETTLRLIRHNGHPTEADVYDSLIERLKKQRRRRPKKKRITLKNALVEIAKVISLNGAFKAREAKRVMLNAGLVANPENADSIVYALLDRYDDFEKVEPGIYRLSDKVQTRLP